MWAVFPDGCNIWKYLKLPKMCSNMWMVVQAYTENNLSWFICCFCIFCLKSTYLFHPFLFSLKLESNSIFVLQFKLTKVIFKSLNIHSCVWTILGGLRYLNHWKTCQRAGGKEVHFIVFLVKTISIHKEETGTNSLMATAVS